MNVWVYAIAKDEARFAARWMQSMAEADGVAVLDTGSTDGTPDILRSLGAVVESRKIEPWRFDTARNESMRLVPPEADVLVCTDLDEILCPGWRRALEDNWREGATTGRYEYVWSFNADGSDGTKFLYEKIHAPGVCRWTHPVHEILSYDVPKVFCELPIRLEHHPDGEKSRAGYLPLLEMSVAEDPDDDRNRHYLGREYMFRGRWDDCIRTLREHLAMPRATWTPERAASMRYIARCYAAKGDAERQELWLFRAAMEAPEQREAWLELGRLAYGRGDWRGCVRYLTRCLDIKKRDMSYTSTPEAWGPAPWDMISIAWWKLGERGYAAACAREALKLGGDKERIGRNLAIFAGK